MKPQTVIHPAYSIPFEQLINGLEHEVNNGNINKRIDGRLTQYTYTQQCTYDSNWNLYTIVARGIIVDETRIVALPFPKFFNLSEKKTDLPDLPFGCYEKVDGSLIIAFWNDTEWRCATKGSFQSDQAIWAKKWMDEYLYVNFEVEKGTTLLFEAIYPENRIVVKYDKPGLVLLGGYTKTGKEIDRYELENIADIICSPICKEYTFDSIGDIITHATTLPSSEEGFVIAYQDGTRVKIKGDEYCRIHRLISNITPLAIWENLKNLDDMDFIRSQIPEEFYEDFDEIVHKIEEKVINIILTVHNVHAKTKEMSDKEIGLQIKTLDKYSQKLLFPIRKLDPNKNVFDDKRIVEGLYKFVRPTGNKLEGYTPSSSMNRVNDDG